MSHEHISIAEMLPKLMDYEFTETTSWGEKKSTYTVRNRILKAFQEHCEYKQTNYRSDRNKFTELVDDIVSKRLSETMKALQTQIDAKVTEACIQEAEIRLKKKLGVKE